MNGPFVVHLRFDPKENGVNHTVQVEAAGWPSGDGIVMCQDPHYIAAAVQKAATALISICPLRAPNIVVAPGGALPD